MTACPLRAERSPLGPPSSTARQPVTKQQDQFAPCRDLYWLAKLPPAARAKLVKKDTINPEHHGRRAHRCARASGNCLSGGRVMPFGEYGQIAADIRERRLRQNPARRGCEYAVSVQ